MTNMLVSVLADFDLVMTITLLGVVLTQVYVKIVEKIQINSKYIFDHSQRIIIDIHELPNI